MTLAEAVLLAVIQGVTEFLPISSSAHLILVPYLLGWEDHSLSFDIVVNAGTLLAALFYFRQDLRETMQQGLLKARGEGAAPLFPLLAVATLPAALVGLLFYDFFASTARNPVLIASTSIGFGLVLAAADRWLTGLRQMQQLGWRDGVVIGAAQALAFLPGTSRSGITITAGLWRGLSREEAARFSFLLAIPIGVLALAKDLLGVLTGQLDDPQWRTLVVGFVVAGLSAYLTIGWLVRWLKEQGLMPFVIYRVLLGAFILVAVLSR